MEKINQTHILVLKEQNGLFELSSKPIEDSSFVVNKIKASVDNPNKTLMDVQSDFLNNFRCLSNGYGYLYPYAYDSSYVSGAYKPRNYTYADYKAELDKRVKNKKETQTIDTTKAIDAVNQSLKTEYFQLCSRYIKQQMMYKAFEEAKNDSQCKMYSREFIGWSSFEYSINDDIKVCIYTNFGFGYASFFTLSVSYKGIVIAPVSHVAKYYKANMTDIIKCTRDYYVDSENWYPMFEFVKEFVNKSLTNPLAFVEKYIMNEIQEMMECLRNIMSNPYAVIQKFRNQRRESLSYYHRLRFISPMSPDEEQRFKVFPIEMPTVFKSEKLEQAVNTLKLLKELLEFYPLINSYIDEIVNMIHKLSPEVENTISRIKKDIERLNIQKNPRIEEAEALKSKIHELTTQLEGRLETLPKGASYSEREEVRKQFMIENPIFKETKDKLTKVEGEIAKLNQDIYSRNSLIESLSHSSNKYIAYLENAR